MLMDLDESVGVVGGFRLEVLVCDPNKWINNDAECQSAHPSHKSRQGVRESRWETIRWPTLKRAYALIRQKNATGSRTTRMATSHVV